MRRFKDASAIGASDMDSRRDRSSYEVGVDVCDPLGCVLECGSRGAGVAARVVRRRCRSEGVDRSPYAAPLEDASHLPRHSPLPNKCHFTLNSSPDALRHPNRFNHECSLPPSATEIGDYVMAHQQNQPYGYYAPGRQKFQRLSPTRPMLVTTLSNTKIDDNHLPKVEELLERVDHEMMEVTAAKQPLKSILNNPLPKSPPPGILKKPKNKVYQDAKVNLEGRRRQRAASESDNLYCTNHYVPNAVGYESRLSNNMKRARDNSGTGYSYGSAFASLSSTPSPRVVPNYQKYRCTCKEQPMVPIKNDVPEYHVLRTTAINNETADEKNPVGIKYRAPSLTPTCPTVSPALPVSSVTTLQTVKKPPKPKKKVKKVNVVKLNSGCKMECGATEAEEDSGCQSPSPDTLTDSTWHMETDELIAEIKNMEKSSARAPPAAPPTPAPLMRDEPEHTSVTKLSNKLNGTVVSPKKVPSKEKDNKEQTFLTALHTTNPFRTMQRKESAACLPDFITSCLRTSLFPRVPPYLKFVGHDETSMVKLPVAIQKHLKWKLTTITPIVVKKTLTNSGFKLVKSECDTSECPQEETVEWIGIWGKHMKSIMFRSIKDGQKMNHFPGTFQIGRKDRLWRNLQKLVAKYGKEEFGIMPKTYVLPHDIKLLKHDWEKYAANNERWIIKPPASARGTGIKVVSRWTQIPKKRPVVVQRYVSKPYLINGNKFDMRLYVLVTSIHPLRIYLYKDGLARFASVKYNDELSSLNDRYMHLTNYSINRLSKNYTPNEDFNACEGHKWTLQTLFQYLKAEKKIDTEALWDSMKDLVIKTIICGEASISSLTKANVTSRYNCYELFGIDVLLDEDLKPWLLEVNISPSLHSASPLDTHVKGPLVAAVLNAAQFQVPLKTNLELLSKEKPHHLASLPYDSRLYTVYLSKEERDKHIIYTNMEDRDMYLRDILSTLTPDDVRHLVQAEDELTQAADLERIFPSRDTHRYLAFLTGPRYYNRLFDAWEARYAKNREPGIELLRNLCDIGYHLEVPPVPLKNDVDAPSPAPSERPSLPSVGSVELLGSGRGCGAASTPRCGEAPPCVPPPRPVPEPRA